MPNTNPRSAGKIEEAATGNENAISDAPANAGEIVRLSAELTGTRLDWANLLAAARATLAAYDEGEGDPLSYLRDELAAQGASFQGRSA